MGWYKEVWFSRGILKHRFLTWLMALDRSPTRDHLLQWGAISESCMLCNNSLESRSHLFFCSFSWDVWLSSSQRLRFSSSILWEEILLELRNFVGNKTARTILLLASQATIYIIWTEKTASYIVTSFAMFFR